VNAFAESIDILHEFLGEAGELLQDVDVKLVELEGRPDDAALLNDIFRGFHTIKGGAGFLEATPLVELCHKTENLFDKLRSGGMALDAALMDRILAATAEVRRMFGEMGGGAMPAAAPADLLAALVAAAEGKPAGAAAPDAAGAAARATDGRADWAAYYAAVRGGPAMPEPEGGSAAAPRAGASSGARPGTPQKETTLRIDTVRFDQILNLSGEIGLMKNRLACIKRDLVAGSRDEGQLRALDEAVDGLEMLVGDLQNAVMKARMQPVGRVFQKYIRQARDLARSLGKDVELALVGEETEVDKTILDELNDPLVHLVRNAVDHGIESPEERAAAGKPAKSVVRLSARQTGEHIVIEIADDGRGMRPEVIRDKAVEKGLLAADDAAVLDERQCLHLIFLPGFSTKSAITDVSGRGVGMDVVKTNIQRLKGRIDIASEPGAGTRITIRLPLTLAILPVLMLALGGQPFAVPLAAVRESLELETARIQRVAGAPHIVLRGEVLPIVPLGDALGRPACDDPRLGVVVQLAEGSMVLGVDALMGRDEVMIKPLEGVKPKGVSGATISGAGELVLVLELHELLAGRAPEHWRAEARAA
jgi:two-component system chemotaxis sensor kinase CheA